MDSDGSGHPCQLKKWRTVKPKYEPYHLLKDGRDGDKSNVFGAADYLYYF